MASSRSVRSNLDLMTENIVLLWSLDEVPEQPKENAIYNENNDMRQLTINRERQLVDSFAFLSAWTKDPKRVMAVAVEEDFDAKGMTIRFASNKGDLEFLESKFTEIAALLVRIARQEISKQDCTQKLLRLVISLTYSRILSRLRSRHAKADYQNKSRPALLRLLYDACHGNQSSSLGSQSASILSKTQTQAKDLLRTFEVLEEISSSNHLSEQGLKVLEDIVAQCHNLNKDGLEIALRGVTDLGLKISLPSSISKLGRYHAIVGDLIKAASTPRYKIFNRISTTSLKGSQFPDFSQPKVCSDFDGALMRVIGSKPSKMLKNVPSPDLLKARAKYDDQRKISKTNRRVHAEMKLLCFYESRPGSPKPRIISSNKRACYLCDLFFKCHGKFRIPGTHGKLYKNWKIPTELGGVNLEVRFQSEMTQFNRALEMRISEALGTRQRVRDHPNESALFLREPWPSNSTLLMSGRPDAASTTRTVISDRAPSDAKSPELEALRTNIADEQNPRSNRSSASKTMLKDQELAESRVPVSEARLSTSTIQPPESTNDEQRKHFRSWQRLDASAHTVSFMMDTMHLRVNWDCDAMSSPETSLLPNAICWVHLTRLRSSREGSPPLTSRGSIDVDKLQDDCDETFTSYAGSGCRQIQLTRADETVLVEFVVENTSA